MVAPMVQQFRQDPMEALRGLIPNPVRDMPHFANEAYNNARAGKPLEAIGSLMQAGAPTGMAMPQGAKWNVPPSDFGDVFHGGPAIIKAIDETRLQSRDYGFYGPGFYTAKSPEVAAWYGGRVTRFSIKPEATILDAGLHPGLADKALVSAVQDAYRAKFEARAAARGRAADFQAQVEAIATDPLEWKRAVKDYAETHNVDVVRYGDGEVVVRNPGVLVPMGRHK